MRIIKKNNTPAPNPQMKIDIIRESISKPNPIGFAIPGVPLIQSSRVKDLGGVALCDV